VWVPLTTQFYAFLLKVPHEAALQVRNSKFSWMLKFLHLLLLLLLTQSSSLSKALPCLWPNLTRRTCTECQGKLRVKHFFPPPPPRNIKSNVFYYTHLLPISLFLGSKESRLIRTREEKTRLKCDVHDICIWAAVSHAEIWVLCPTCRVTAMQKCKSTFFWRTLLSLKQPRIIARGSQYTYLNCKK
jgi:hypothetical protein